MPEFIPGLQLSELYYPEAVKHIPNVIGSINQVVDSTDILTNPSLTKKWQALFLEE